MRSLMLSMELADLRRTLESLTSRLSNAQDYL